jgi:PAS domain S-box-containing protein
MSLLGVNEAQLKGKNLSNFINSKTYQDKFYLHRNLVIKKESSQQFECEFKRGDGSLFYGLIDSSVIKNEKNKFKNFLSIISDISEQKFQERLLEKALKKEKELNRMKSQFITIASHEFRTPLATILTSAELIEKYNNPEDAEKKVKHFQKIKTAVNRVKEILMDFLSVEEVEKGKIVNNPETFDLVEFITNHIEETKQFNGIHIHNYSHVGKHKTVSLDKKLLKICLTNLLINAYKYSPNGGTIETSSEQLTPGNIVIKIKDNGIGIPQEDQEHIFERFFRANNADTIQGTGLGLNITQALVKLMGGSIFFLSETNKGTTFILKFPK